jgi:hypothetical protein
VGGVYESSSLQVFEEQKRAAAILPLEDSTTRRLVD